MARPLKRNLLRDGLPACVDHVVSAITRARGTHCVYVDDKGGLRVIPLWPANQSPRPESELVGAYTRRATAELIRGDLEECINERN